MEFFFNLREHEASSALTYGPSNNYVIFMLKAEHSVKAKFAWLNFSAHITTRVLLAAKELPMKPLNQSRWLLARNQKVVSLILNIKDFFFDFRW